MENQQYFIVLQSVDNSSSTSNRSRQTDVSETIYPEVHYVFANDAFSPEMDAVERNPGDVSVLVDLDETGREIRGCQSISPDWQVTDASLIPQALDTTSVNSVPQHSSMLLKINGTRATQNQDIISLKGDAKSGIAAGISLIEQIEARQREIQKAISSFPEDMTEFHS